MAGKRGMTWAWWKWFPQDFMAAIGPLDLMATGAWITVICDCQLNRSNPGVKEARLAGLAQQWRVTTDKALGICLELAATRVADMEIDLMDDTGWRPYSDALAAGLHGKPSNPFWGVKMKCRRVQKDAAKRENEKDDAKSTKNGEMVFIPNDIEKESREMAFPRDTNTKDAGEMTNHFRHKKQRHIYTPPTPSRGGKRLTVSEKKHNHVSTNSPAMIRFGSWFGRKPTTLWTVAESEALDAWMDGVDLEDVDVVERFYLAARAEFGSDVKAMGKAGMFPCREPMTMFNKWSRQVAMAREWDDKHASNGKMCDGKIL